MAKNAQGDPPAGAEWWNSKPDRETKELWQDAVEDYLEQQDTDAENVEFSLELVKKMIPSIKVRDPRWKNFPKAQFDIQLFKAHRQLYDTIRNKLDSLINLSQK